MKLKWGNSLAMLRAAELKERCGPTTHDDLYCRTGWDQAEHVTGKIWKSPSTQHRYVRQNGSENEKIQNIKAPSEHMNITCGRWMRVHLLSPFSVVSLTLLSLHYSVSSLYTLCPLALTQRQLSSCRNSGWPTHWYAAVAILVICSAYRIVSLAHLKHMNSLIYLFSSLFVLHVYWLCRGSFIIAH